MEIDHQMGQVKNPAIVLVQRSSLDAESKLILYGQSAMFIRLPSISYLISLPLFY